MASEPEADRPRPEQTFFQDPVLDRVLGMAMALSAEVYVLRDRVRRLEWALEKAGVLPADAVRDLEPTAEQREAAARDRDAFAAAMMENLLGRQASRGAP